MAILVEQLGYFYYFNQRMDTVIQLQSKGQLVWIFHSYG